MRLLLALLVVLLLIAAPAVLLLRSRRAIANGSAPEHEPAPEVWSPGEHDEPSTHPEQVRGQHAHRPDGRPIPGSRPYREQQHPEGG